MSAKDTAKKEIPSAEKLVDQINLAIQKKDLQRAEKLLADLESVNRIAAAEVCLAIVERHRSLTDGEKDLLDTIKNQIRVKFGLPGAIPPIVDFEANSTAPDKWFW